MINNSERKKVPLWLLIGSVDLGGRSIAGSADSNPAEGMDVRLLCFML